jgi:hypothetical protein
MVWHYDKPVVTTFAKGFLSIKMADRIALHDSQLS